MPIGGPITSHVSGNMTGATLTEARQANRIFGVLTMDGGTIDRQLVSLASTDIRSLFGGRSGSGRLDCLLVILNLQDGRARSHRSGSRLLAGRSPAAAVMTQGATSST